jgi:hypothetical protein
MRSHELSLSRGMTVEQGHALPAECLKRLFPQPQICVPRRHSFRPPEMKFLSG